MRWFVLFYPASIIIFYSSVIYQQFLEKVHLGEKLCKAKNKDPVGKKKSGARNDKAANQAQALNIFIGSDEEDQEQVVADNYSGYDVDTKKIEDALLESLYLCTKCNGNKDKADRIPCKISKSGFHVQLSHQLITGWVRALVSHILASLLCKLIYPL